jgi:pimeloyl-ACP methyl ester carboxylesterase
VLALLDQQGVERAVLAGMSQGGFVSLRAGLTAPDRVRGTGADRQRGQPGGLGQRAGV